MGRVVNLTLGQNVLMAQPSRRLRHDQRLAYVARNFLFKTRNPYKTPAVLMHARIGLAFAMADVVNEFGGTFDSLFNNGTPTTRIQTAKG